jgi:hypothetical protein
LFCFCFTYIKLQNVNRIGGVMVYLLASSVIDSAGADQGGVAPAAPPPPKIGKKMIFWRKIVIFHTKYPNKLCASLRNWKKYDFLA